MSLESQRLIYERVTRNHAKELEPILCDPKVYEHMDDGIGPTSDELLKAFTLREQGPSAHRHNETWVDYIVRDKASQIAIGRVEATVIEHRAEVAYILGTAYWRQGYGSEALVWLQDFVQEQYSVREFWATVTPGNEASKHLLLKHSYVEISNKPLPKLTSYEDGDWVFFRRAFW
ncbi:GNAT family N-acetyltransferase [Acaryochloris sp. CCMEE 5410]|uniref:GNAT family N-acetyltransferase n=1 Tax=Acaryochloris sp. CCMEE 5410 TaxID=310037 RepID=UPI0002484B4B|nr:GNAT family N-acetyltransferase [Acaryochloris sp. CCMEE 5410]KAI9132682.1 GNAT family N-acetyltransferase [Acaryochloris sp. CCMEE 5410]